MIKFIAELSRIGSKITFRLLPETLISFLIVGSFGVLVHLAVLKTAMAWVLPEFKYANLLAMLVAATFNFILNNKSTFSDKALVGRHILLGYLFYIGITALGLAISLFISTRVYAQHGAPIIAALCGIAAGSLWNYFMSYTFVWKLLSNLSRQRDIAN
jgi:putative flippase GtrA